MLSFFYFAAKSENAGQMSHQSCVKIKRVLKEHSKFIFSIVLGGATSMASEDKGKQMSLLIWHVYYGLVCMSKTKQERESGHS